MTARRTGGIGPAIRGRWVPISGIVLITIVAWVWLLSSLAPTDPKAWAREAIGYHLYLRSFADSNGDGYGDFRGVTEKLGYLSGLGVDVILLSPPMDNAGPNDYYGGYAVTDLRAAETDYGPLQGGTGSGSLEELISAAHEQGMRVLIDMPLNTAGAQHPAFLDSVAMGESSQYWGLFVWSQPNAEGQCSPTPKRFLGDPSRSMWVRTTVGTSATPTPMCYWAPWANDVPEWNYTDPGTVSYIQETLVWWVNTMKVDGFRFDSAGALVDEDPVRRRDESPETMAILQRFVSALRANNPQTYVFGESITQDQGTVDRLYAEGGLRALTAYTVHNAIRDALESETKTRLLDAAQTQYAQHGVDLQLFIDNHDMWQVPDGTVRSWDRFPTRDSASDAARVADQGALAALLFSLPGTPFIYYGQEIGLPAAPPCIECPGPVRTWSRNPMQWVRSSQASNNGWGDKPGPWVPLSDRQDVWAEGEGADLHGIRSVFAKLAAVRQASNALREGGFQQLSTSAPNSLVFLRWYDSTLAWHSSGKSDDFTLVLMNLSRTTATPPQVDLCAIGIGNASVLNRVSPQAVEEQVTPSSSAQYHTAPLAPREVKWLQLTSISPSPECPRPAAR